MKSFLYSLLIVCLLSVLPRAWPAVVTAQGMGATPDGGAVPAPKQCQVGKTSPRALGWRWKPGTHVNVYYLKNNFSGPEREALTQAVNNWNDALREIDAHVLFVINGESESVAKADEASIMVIRGVPREQERLGEIRFSSVSSGAVHLVAVMGPLITDPRALQSLMTHEVGHSLGLADCYECRRATTAMAAFKDVNKGNDVYAPSGCDKYIVAAGYAGAGGAQEARVVPAGRK